MLIAMNRLKAVLDVIGAHLEHTVGEHLVSRRFSWSGRPGSNRRHSAWEADVLPLNYSRPRAFAAQTHSTCMAEILQQVSRTPQQMAIFEARAKRAALVPLSTSLTPGVPKTSSPAIRRSIAIPSPTHRINRQLKLWPPAKNRHLASWAQSRHATMLAHLPRS